MSDRPPDNEQHPLQEGAPSTGLDQKPELENESNRHALQLAQRFHVFPVDHPTTPYCDGIKTKEHDPRTCTERGKHPKCKWSEWSTQDPGKLCSPQYFGSGRPCNIGIDCGRSRLLVVDEDATGEFDRFCADIGVEVPVTFTVRTGKGRHFYFRQRDGDAFGNQEGALRGYKINVRGIGGYVVGPGSMHAAGIAYEAIVDIDPIEIPDWLIKALTGQAPSNGDSPFVTVDTGPKDHTWWREGPISEGNRHHAIVAAAGWCRTKGLSLEAARPMVRDVWSRSQGSKYTWEQAEARLDDVYSRYPAGNRLEEDPSGTEGTDDEDPFLDWHELFTEETPDVEWLFDGVFALGRGHAIYAKHKVGKSLFALWCCAQLATTRTDVDVIYLDYEMTRADVRERLEDMGFDADSDLSRLHYALLPSMPPLDTGEGMAAMLELVDRVQRPDCHAFVVVDTTGRAAQGKENDADTFRDFYRWTGIALKRRGVTCARLDHAGKDEGQGQRGSSGKGDDVDVIWKLIAGDGGVTLHRDAARMAWVEDNVTFRIHIDPLRYERGYGVPPAGTHDLAAQLDKLGVPSESGRPTCRKALKDAGLTATNKILEAAIRWRRLEVTALPDLTTGSQEVKSTGSPTGSPQKPSLTSTGSSTGSDGQPSAVSRAAPVSLDTGSPDGPPRQVEMDW
jgi:hypothetical protein